MTAYFTEPLSDEFRKAIEEAIKGIDEESERKGRRELRRKGNAVARKSSIRKRPKKDEDERSRNSRLPFH